MDFKTLAYGVLEFLKVAVPMALAIFALWRQFKQDRTESKKIVTEATKINAEAADINVGTAMELMGVLKQHIVYLDTEIAKLKISIAELEDALKLKDDRIITLETLTVQQSRQIQELQLEVIELKSALAKALEANTRLCDELKVAKDTK